MIFNSLRFYNLTVLQKRWEKHLREQVQHLLVFMNKADTKERVLTHFQTDWGKSLKLTTLTQQCFLTTFKVFWNVVNIMTRLLDVCFFKIKEEMHQWSTEKWLFNYHPKFLENKSWYFTSNNIYCIIILYWKLHLDSHFLNHIILITPSRLSLF